MSETLPPVGIARRPSTPGIALDPNPRTGWEPETPVTDTLLRPFLVNWTTAIEAHGTALGGRRLRRDDLAAVDVGRPSVGDNVATLLPPLFPDGLAGVAAALDDFYGFTTGAATGAVVLFSPWPTPDLRPHGWTLLDHQPLMLRTPGGEPPPPPPNLRIAEVRDEESLRAFTATMVRGLPVPEVEAQAPESVFSPRLLTDDRIRMWVGWEEERPVSAAASFVAAGINDVTLVATVPEARRRGSGAAVTWRATWADPTLPAMLLATDAGRPVDERMGYLPLCRFTPWSRDRAGHPGTTSD